MKKESFDKANKLYNVIHDAQQDLKDIRWYEQKHYKHGIPMILKVPYTTGICSVDSDVVIVDKELIKDVLNTIKIHCVKVIQNAEKELEGL